MENIMEWFNNLTLPTGLFAYVIIAAVIVGIMTLFTKILPAASMIINIVIAGAAVYLAFTNLHLGLAIKAVAIFFVLMFIVKMITSEKTPKGAKKKTVACIRYTGKDGNGKDTYELTYPGQKQDADDTSDASGYRYMGQDEKGNDVFKFTVKK
jgi:hypothetical protein